MFTRPADQAEAEITQGLQQIRAHRLKQAASDDEKTAIAVQVLPF